MEVLPLLVFVCMAVSFIPQVNSLKCFKCGGSLHPCGSANTNTTNCNRTEDRCGTLVIKQGQKPKTTKSCFNSTICEPKSSTNPCVQRKMLPPNCTFTCCEGDLCNSSPTSPRPTKHLPEFTATIGILIPSVLLAKVI